MKRIIPITIVIILLTACRHTPSRDQAIADIVACEQQLAQVSVATDEETARQMTDLYCQFATLFPDDSLAPVYLSRAADISLNLGDNQQAIAILDSIIELYPGYEDIAGCLFLKGQAYENSEQYDLARQTYTQFVTEYPDHVLAPDTRIMLPYIGLPIEEMFNALIGDNTDKQ